MKTACHIIRYYYPFQSTMHSKIVKHTSLISDSISFPHLQTPHEEPDCWTNSQQLAEQIHCVGSKILAVQNALCLTHLAFHALAVLE